MFPYRFNNKPAPQPASPSAPTVPLAPRPRERRAGMAALLLAALGAGAAGGGVAGALFANHQQPVPAASTTTPSSTLPIQANNQAQTANVAGAVFNSAGPSVVRVISAGEVRGGLTPEGSGSGFVVDASGLILTNYHVVGSADNVSVRFSDGTTAPATVLGTDRGNDLALLQADVPDNIAALSLADSDNVAVGETAIAIGSPFGLDGTVTQGIVSAIDRTWSGGAGRAQRDLIQTDAPINPGNSGGPLLNAVGEVIGINTMIESPVRGNVGVGFAVPINTAQRVLEQLQAGAALEPVWLGITSQGNTTAAPNGIVVTQVMAGSAAQQAGIQVGDTITAINGTTVTALDQLSEQLATFQPGDNVTVTVERSGAAQEIEVTLQAWPEQIQ